MLRSTLKVLLLAGAIASALAGNAPASPMNSGEKLIPTVTKLNFDKVGFFVDTQPQYTERLTALGMKKLTDAGLYTKAHDAVSRSEEIGFLKLTLNPIPPEEGCKGKIMYEIRLELWEEVSPLRNREIHFQAVTWSYGLSTPVIRDEVTLEQLQADLDKFLSEFVISYKMGNPAKK